MKRCTGHCCEYIDIPLSPADLAVALERHETWRRWGAPPTADECECDESVGFECRPCAEHLDWQPVPPIPQHVEIIAPMLTHIETVDGRAYYSCNNFDTETRDCLIYETRPDMCSNYPYGRGCTQPECTWTEQRRDTLRAERLRVLQ